MKKRSPTVSFLEKQLLLLLLGVIVVLAWDWNWFRPLLERQASAAAGRPVTIGNLGVQLGLHPQIVLDDISLGNPEDFTDEPTMASLKRLAVRADLLGFWHHRVYVDEVALGEAHADLHPGPSGVPNWVFNVPPGKPAQKPDPNPWQVQIARLAVDPGEVHFRDPAYKSDFLLRFRTEPDDRSGEERIVVDITGRYSGQPIEGRFRGGSALTLRDAAKPYPVDLRLATGATRVSADGTLLRPLEFGGANVRIQFRGDNLADLFPLTGIPLPPTAPYQLEGELDYSASKIGFRNFTGTVGSSDLSGTITVDPHHVRPQVTADMTSKQVVLSDLGGFVGAAPGEKKTQDPEELKKERAAKDANPRVLPDQKIDLPRLRAADLDVHYHAGRIQSDTMPFDELVAYLTIVDGRIRFQPLQFKIGDGSIVTQLDIDGGGDNTVDTNAQIDFRQIDLSRILEQMNLHKGEGRIAGHAVLKTHGNSVAQALGRGDGELQLFMTGGDFSALLIDLAGLDFGNAVLSALGVPSRARLRCMVADMGLTKGQLDTRSFIVDTTEANIVVTGGANFADESLKMRMETHPKSINLLSLRSPIDVSGTFKTPKVRPDTLALVKRGGAAVALGVLFTPLAALLPTIQLGLGKDTDCQSILSDVGPQAKQAARNSPATVAPKPSPEVQPAPEIEVEKEKQKVR